MRSSCTGAVTTVPRGSQPGEGGTPLACEQSDLFGPFLAVAASRRKRHGSQPRRGNLLAASLANTVLARGKPLERRVDLVPRLRLHLREREVDVFMGRIVGNVSHRPARVYTIPVTKDADPAKHLTVENATVLLKHLLQLGLGQRHHVATRQSARLSHAEHGTEPTANKSLAWSQHGRVNAP